MERQELKLFSELYESSKPLETDDLETLQQKAKLYDINPNLNFKIMDNMIKNENLTTQDSENFYKFFVNYSNTIL